MTFRVLEAHNMLADRGLAVMQVLAADTVWHTTLTGSRHRSLAAVSARALAFLPVGGN